MSNYTLTEETYEQNEYISVNGFINSRRKNNLKELLCFYVDLDVTETKEFNNIYNELITYEDEYNPEVLNEMIHNRYIDIILDKCSQKGLPNPSKINYSGNGYHLYWNIKEYSKSLYFDRFYGASHKLIKSYELIEKQLVAVFKDLGADNKATDSTRLLRKENTINTKNFATCKRIYSCDTEVEFKEFADKLLKYSYKEVVEYKAITEKQVEFILENDLATKKEIKKLDKFSAKKLISSFINSESKATDKQIAYLKRLGYVLEDNETLTIEEANRQIRLINVKKSNNRDYVYNILNKAFNNGDIIEGNRAYFYYYLGIASLRIELNEEETLELATKFNQKLQMSEKEMTYHVLSSRKQNIYSLNIKKTTILDHLGLDTNKYLTKPKKALKRSNKAYMSDKYNEFKKNITKYKKMSLRKVADELEISKSTVSNFVKRIKDELIKIKELKEQNKELHNEFLTELPGSNELEMIAKYIDESIEIKKIIECPQKL